MKKRWKKYLCSLCGKRFSQLDCLRKHQNTHSGARPHVCVECGNAFNSADALKRHRRIHTGEKPYSCSESESVRTPETTREGSYGTEAVYCSLCGGASAQQGIYRIMWKHIDRHESDKPRGWKLMQWDQKNVCWNHTGVFYMCCICRELEMHSGNCYSMHGWKYIIILIRSVWLL